MGCGGRAGVRARGNGTTTRQVLLGAEARERGSDRPDEERMNGRELMSRFLEGENVDRLPVCPMFDRDYMMKAAGIPERPWGELENPERLAVIEGCYRRHPGVDFVFCPSGTVDRSLYGPAGRNFDPTGEDPDGLAGQIGEPPSVSQVLGTGIYEYLPGLVDRLGQDALPAFTINVPFAHTVELFGAYEQGLVALAARPDAFKVVYLALCRRQVSFMEAAAGTGMPAVWITQYYAGCDTISPSTYREVALPGERLLFDAAQRLGLKTMYWFLGDLLPILPDILTLRPDALVLEPGRKGYLVDVDSVRKVAGPGLNICGCPDEQDVAFGRLEGISASVRAFVKAATDGPMAVTTPILKADTDEATVDFLIEACGRNQLSPKGE